MNASYTSPTPSGKPFQTLENLEAYQLALEFRKAMYAVDRRLPYISGPFADLPF